MFRANTPNLERGKLFQSNAFALYKTLLEEDLIIHFYMEFCLGKKFQKAGEELKIVESLSREASMLRYHIQKDLEKIERKEACKPKYRVETVLGPWFHGQTDTW